MSPEKSCSGCDVCCIVPPVKAEGLSKTSGVACPNCVRGSGCAIYATRPQPCRGFECGWRELPFLDARWKPDICGLLVLTDESDVPLSFARRVALSLVAFRSRADLEPALVIEMCAGLVVAEVPLFLSVPGPPGTHFAKALLNPLILRPARARDGASIRGALLAAYDRLRDGTFLPVDLDETGPVRTQSNHAAPAPENEK